MLSPKEKLLAEAITNMLNDNSGVVTHKDQADQSHSAAYLHEEIEQEFHLDTIDFEHHNSVCSAFSKIHTHKYMTDATFITAFRKEMASTAVPEKEQAAAIKLLEKAQKALKGKTEGDAGWNPKLGEIKAATQVESKKNQKAITEDISFYSNPEARRWLNTQPSFWKLVKTEISPVMEELGFKHKTIREFWESYDEAHASEIFGTKLNLFLEHLNQGKAKQITG